MRCPRYMGAAGLFLLTTTLANQQLARAGDPVTQPRWQETVKHCQERGAAVKAWWNKPQVKEARSVSGRIIGGTVKGVAGSLAVVATCLMASQVPDLPIWAPLATGSTGLLALGSSLKTFKPWIDRGVRATTSLITNPLVGDQRRAQVGELQARRDKLFRVLHDESELYAMTATETWDPKREGWDILDKTHRLLWPLGKGTGAIIPALQADKRIAEATRLLDRADANHRRVWRRDQPE